MKMVPLKIFSQQSGLSTFALRHLISEGKLPAVHVGAGRGKIFLPADAAFAALESMAAANTQRSIEISGNIRRILE